MSPKELEKYSYNELCKIRDSLDRIKKPEEYSQVVEAIYKISAQPDRDDIFSTHERKHDLRTKPYIARRMTAFLIDSFITFCFMLLMLWIFGEPDGTGNIKLSGWPVLAVFGFWALVTVGTEQLLGATIGNLAVDLKPVSLKNRGQITISQSFKRHLISFIDLTFFGLVAIILIKSTEYNQRLGDIWAKTVVIKDED